jgi:hypothetical protein
MGRQKKSDKQPRPTEVQSTKFKVQNCQKHVLELCLFAG